MKRTTLKNPQTLKQLKKPKEKTHNLSHSTHF